MLSDQEIDGFAHPLQVERQMKPPGAPREQRRPHRVVVENIAVASRQCRVARVKIPGYRSRPLHGDLFGKQRVCAAHPRRLGALHRGFEMRHLGVCVHARVGASGAGHGDRLAAYFRKHPREMILHGVAGGLRLPAFQTRAAVAHSDGKFHSTIPKTTIGARGADRSKRTQWRSAECLEHRLGLLLLRRIAFFHHFLQQLPRPVLVAHLFVRLGEIEFGRDLLPSRVRSTA